MTKGKAVLTLLISRTIYQAQGISLGLNDAMESAYPRTRFHAEINILIEVYLELVCR